MSSTNTVRRRFPVIQEMMGIVLGVYALVSIVLTLVYDIASNTGQLDSGVALPFSGVIINISPMLSLNAICAVGALLIFALSEADSRGMQREWDSERARADEIEQSGRELKGRAERAYLFARFRGQQRHYRPLWFDALLIGFLLHTLAGAPLPLLAFRECCYWGAWALFSLVPVAYLLRHKDAI